VKRNAIAGHAFASWAALEAHLAWWMREIADVREHGTTGEAPIARFQREEAAALRPLEGRPPFRQVRDLIRRVSSDCCVEIDTNAYSVPWRLIGETVRVVVAGGRVSIQHGGAEVAVHPESAGRRQRRVEAAHFAGLSPAPTPVRPADTPTPAPPPVPDLLRPLQDYEQAIGGGW
jgi:hypothetical protein